MRTYPAAFTRILLGLSLGGAASTSARAEEAPVMAPRQLSPAGEGNCRYPKWSRDGKKLAFERVFLTERRVELHIIEDVTAASPSTTRLQAKAGGGGGGRLGGFSGRRGARGDVCTDLAWGVGRLAFACSSGTMRLFMKQQSFVVPVMQNGTSGQPDWSRDGSHVAFVASLGAPGTVFVSAVSPTGQLQPKAITPDDARNGRLGLNPRWSPSTDALVFTRFTPGEGGDLVLVEKATSANPKVRVLTHYNKDDEFNPSWSPDGTKIAFYRATQGGAIKPSGEALEEIEEVKGEYGLYIYNLGGDGNIFRVSRKAHVSKQGPSWTPDSKWILYSSSFRDYDPIFAAEAVEGGGKSFLPVGTTSNRNPVVTEREGKWILAYTALGMRSGGKRVWRKLYVAPLDLLQAGKLEVKWRGRDRDPRR